MGKSTLLNALTGTSRAIVSPIAELRATRWTRLWSSRASNCGLWIRRIRRKGKTHLMAEK